MFRVYLAILTYLILQAHCIWATSINFDHDPLSNYHIEVSSDSVTLKGFSRFFSREITEVVIPEGVTTIASNAFYNKKITKVIIPDSVTTISKYAFAHNQLTEVIIPDSVISIGKNAFAHNQLTEVIIPDSVTSIGSYAFTRNQLTEVVIPDSVTSISKGTFSNNQLTEVIIPGSVTSINEMAFFKNHLTEVIIPESVTYIAEFAFGNNLLTEIFIPKSVNIIKDWAFTSNQISKIIISDKSTSIRIDKFAFTSNPKLEEVIAPPSISDELNFNDFTGRRLTPTDQSIQKSTPYDKDTADQQDHIAKKIVHLLDHFTVGAIQTFVGSSHILIYAFDQQGAPGLPDIGVHTNHNEVIQFVIDGEPLYKNAGAYSMGAFQITPQSISIEIPHEGGHSVASSTLGPLYAPTVFLSYLIEGYRNSFIERWADLEILPKNYIPTAAVKVGAGQSQVGDVKIPYVVFDISLDELQKTKKYDLEISKVYSWLNGKLLAPLIEDAVEKGIGPVAFEINLLEKKMTLYSNETFVLKTKQQYLNVEKNFFENLFHIKALDWEAQYGLTFDRKNFDTDITLGVGAYTGWRTSTTPQYYGMQKNTVWETGLSLNSRLNFTFGSYLSLYGEAEYRWSTFMNGYTLSAGLTNSLRDPDKSYGNLLDTLEFSSAFKYNFENNDDYSFENYSFEFTVGIRK